MEETALSEKARELARLGRTEDAASLAKARDTKAINDPSVHLQWADLLEELGLIDEVIVELNLAIRDGPEEVGTYRRLAEIYMDQGNPDRAARCWSALIGRNPGEPSFYKELGKILEESGSYEKALEIYRTGAAKTGDEKFNALIRSMDFVKAEEAGEAPVEKADQILPTQHHLVTFTALFAGREGVYARQWASPTGETGYTPVHEPLTLKVAENHILGNMTVGVYPVRIDNTVNFIAFDLDLPKFVIGKTIRSKELWDRAMAKVHRAACKLVDLGAAHEVPIHIEDSGFKGRHCWIFLDTPVPAGVARKFGETLLTQLERTPEVAFEVFPKQGRVPQGSLGNLIKIPLGFHKKTGRRSLFIQPEGTPYSSQLEFLESAAKASRRAVYALIQRFQQKQEKAPEPEPPWEEEKEERRWEPPPKVVEEYDLERDGQFQYLLLKCPALRSIIEKVNREATIGKEETLVLVHTIGHLDRGPDAVNQVFQRCLNADPTLFLKSKLRGNPMSCPKIRARIPQVTSSIACNCRFDPNVNLYPTPLIHVYTMPDQKPGSPIGLTVDSLRFQNMLQEYLKLRKQMREINVLMGKYEKELEAFFENAGIEKLETPLGTMKITKSPDGGVSFSLEMGPTKDSRQL